MGERVVTAKTPLTPATREAILDRLRQIASEPSRSDLAATLMQGRTVYQDDGTGRIERIERDGSRSLGRFVNRRFIADEPLTHT